MNQRWVFADSGHERIICWLKQTVLNKNYWKACYLNDKRATHALIAEESQQTWCRWDLFVQDASQRRVGDPRFVNLWVMRRDTQEQAAPPVIGCVPINPRVTVQVNLRSVIRPAPWNSSRIKWTNCYTFQWHVLRVRMPVYAWEFLWMPAGVRFHLFLCPVWEQESILCVHMCLLHVCISSKLTVVVVVCVPFSLMYLCSWMSLDLYCCLNHGFTNLVDWFVVGGRGRGGFGVARHDARCRRQHAARGGASPGRRLVVPGNQLLTRLRRGLRRR